MSYSKEFVDFMEISENIAKTTGLITAKVTLTEKQVERIEDDIDDLNSKIDKAKTEKTIQKHKRLKLVTERELQEKKSILAKYNDDFLNSTNGCGIDLSITLKDFMQILEELS